MHYTRQRKGKPLVDTRPELGSPDGFGRYGILDDDGAAVLCHECGVRKRALGHHVSTVHDMTPRAYRQAHGLPLRKPLETAEVSANRSERAVNRIGSADWDKLVAARDPAKASRARDEDSFRRATADLAAAAERARVNGRTVRLEQVRYCPICGASWCPLPGGYRLQTCSRECWRALQTAGSMLEEPPNTWRDKAIRTEHAAGATYKELAERHGVTTTRIGQIVHGRPDGVDRHGRPIA